MPLPLPRVLPVGVVGVLDPRLPLWVGEGVTLASVPRRWDEGEKK